MSIAKQCIGLLDLTSLQDNDTEQSIQELCSKARTPIGSVAAVCVYPQFVSSAAAALKGSGIDVATVINFPTGQLSADQCQDHIKQAIDAGATEIDFVIDWRKFNDNGSTPQGMDMLGQYVRQMVHFCGSARSKVILESGHLVNADLIRRASEVCLDAGVHFLKTSTGKMQTGATLEAAKVMLEVIHAKQLPNRGLKVAGGVRTVDDAAKYVQLASNIMGAQFISKSTFRIGASGLRDALLKYES